MIYIIFVVSSHLNFDFKEGLFLHPLQRMNTLSISCVKYLQNSSPTTGYLIGLLIIVHILSEGQDPIHDLIIHENKDNKI
jgi:hypothetical protein